MTDTLNEVFINEDLLEEINKFIGNGVIFTFPVVSVGKSSVFFNTAATKAGLIKDAIKWFATKEYVIGLPAKKGDKNAFAVNSRNRGGVIAAFPLQLRKEKNIQYGYYRLYKFKDGFAFKRNEPIEEENNGTVNSDAG